MYVAFIEFSSLSPKSSSIDKCERGSERKKRGEKIYLRSPVGNHHPVKTTSNNGLDMLPKLAIESIEK